ncbi:hypothetical protein LEN26_018976 [Aphanomyces euteiches]|nr:hypothetical protein LEN26_018976 [Aphanomyces euteiches]
MATKSAPLLGMELYVEKVLDTARQLNQRLPPQQSLTLSKWKCHRALDALSYSSAGDSSPEDFATVRPVSKETLRFHSKLVQDDNCSKFSSSSIDDPSLRAHIQRYADRYNGLEAYGTSGMSKLQQIIDTATAMQRGCRATNDLGVSLGVAVLSSSGHIFTSSSDDLCLDTCPERLAFMKLASDEDDFVVEGCAIASSDELFTPYPCGNCREFLSQFGDFPLYLIRANMEFEKTSAYALFPRGNMASQGSKSKHVQVPLKAKETLKPRHVVHLNDWLVGHVIDWLVEDVGLAEYGALFESHQVNGATLRYLQESDLQYLLHIQHPLHRKRIALCLDRLRNQDAVHSGVEYGQLQDYLAVLDKDRIEVVVKLKEAFDAVDTNRNGRLDFSEVKQALSKLNYDASATAVEAWIQSRSDQTSVSFPEFALAFCHTWTSNTLTLPVPKVDLKNVRAAFDRVDTDGNGSLEKSEVATALAALGQANSEEQAEEWFRQVDADGSNSLSFPEFLLRFAQLHFDISPLRQAYDSFVEKDVFALGNLPPAFRALHVLYNRQKMDKWMEARLNTSLLFSDFVLAYFLFVQAPEPISNDQDAHRFRIVQLQQSGHVRLCSKPTSFVLPSSPQKKKTRRQNTHDEYKQDDGSDDENKAADSDDDESKRDEEDDEYTKVHKMFRRFHDKNLTTLEAMQAITELGVVVPRTQMLEYFTSQGFGTKREIDCDDLVYAYRALQVFKPRRQKQNKESHKFQMKTMQALLDGKYGVPYTRKDFEIHDMLKDDDASLKMDQREWAQEMKTWVSKRQQRRARDESKDDFDDEGSPMKQQLHHRGRFQIGDRVVDKTRAMGPGTIVRMNGTYQVCSIHYDSGIKRHNVALASIRRFKDAPLAAFRVVEAFEKGARVQVLYKGTKAIRHGTVTKVRSNDEYDVAYSDGEVEKHVPHKHLAKSTKATEEEWDEGMQVDARGKDSPTYYRGEILLVRINGTFDVKFKNGAEEQKLPRKWIRKHQSKDKKTTKEHDKNRDDDNLYKEDDIVEAKVTGSDKYFRGKIVKCRTNGTFDILFDDGDKEKGVVKDSIRSIQLNKGDAIEARFGGKESFFPGTIQRIHSDGTYDIEYDDGDSETRVDAKLVRLRKKESQFEVGQAVEARFGGNDKYYEGKITRIHSDGSMDIHYADGDKESHVKPQLVCVRSSKDDGKYDDDFE